MAIYVEKEEKKMRKSSILVATLLAGMSLTLVGCNKNDQYKAENLKKVDATAYETTYRSMRINGTGYTAEQYSRVAVEKEDGTKASKYVVADVKALVIPVDFTDYPASSMPLGVDGTRQQLQTMMFGTDKEVEWYSLAGYYKSSSYGQCNVTGTVGDWYHVDMTSEAFAKQAGYDSKTHKGGTGGSQTIANAVEELYHNKYEEARDNGDTAAMAKYDLTQYDANKDGYVDSLIMIYTAPIDTTGSIWWAFCSSISGAFGKYTPTMEGMNRFFWASYWFFFDAYLDNYKVPEDLPAKIQSGEATMDSHTMIHEYGHVLGMPDYYITDYNSSDFDGMGYLDMMDYNIGDHNSASKSWYGWVEPYYAVGSTKVTLRSATKTGDCLILPIQGEYKNTLMDQYIMIEFITPEGVAKMDGEKKFAGNYPLYYNKAGVRVLHVDARLGVQTYNQSKGEWTFVGFTSSTNRPDSSSYVTTACSNTATDSCFKDYKLLEILPSDGKSIKYKGQATNECLYHEGDTFGAEGGPWANYMMHDISGGKTVPLGFKFEITKMDGNKSVDITITKI